MTRMYANENGGWFIMEVCAYEREMPTRLTRSTETAMKPASFVPYVVAINAMRTATANSARSQNVRRSRSRDMSGQYDMRISRDTPA